MKKSTIKAIKNRLNIADVAGHYLTLKKCGEDYMAHCPFHEDRTPSFMVDPSKGIFKCFSCGRGGDMVKLVETLGRTDFRGAMKFLGRLAHISTGTLRKAHPHYQDKYQARWANVNAQLAKVYTHLLLDTQAGAKAKRYLVSVRHLSTAEIKRFGLGFVPAQTASGASAEQANRLIADRIITSGLSKQAAGRALHESCIYNARLHNRFTGRITIPLKDRYGHIVAFAGRALPNSNTQAKYLNSPDNRYFQRNRFLFNANRAKQFSGQDIVLCEGFFDVIALDLAGVHNVVASLGTSLTSAQAKQLARLSRTVVICYDGDMAGEVATNRATNLIKRYTDANVKVIRLPRQLDPDDYRKQYGRTKLASYVKSHVESVLYFEINHFVAKINHSAPSIQYRDTKITVALIQNLVSSPLQRYFYLKDFAHRIGAPVSMLELKHLSMAE